jgi:hypothetical protein
MLSWYFRVTNNTTLVMGRREYMFVLNTKIFKENLQTKNENSERGWKQIYFRGDKRDQT